jgi:hypothetical protein
MCHRRKSIRALTPPCATSLQGIAGINYTYTSLPARTKIPGSSYTACVDDVYNGIVDFCAADFWCAIRLSLKNYALGFGTARQKMALERWTNPKPSLPTCTCEYGVPS